VQRWHREVSRFSFSFRFSFHFCFHFFHLSFHPLQFSRTAHSSSVYRQSPLTDGFLQADERIVFFGCYTSGLSVLKPGWLGLSAVRFQSSDGFCTAGVTVRWWFCRKHRGWYGQAQPSTNHTGQRFAAIGIRQQIKSRCFIFLLYLVSIFVI